VYEALKRNRAAVEHAILALALPFVAGAINASGFFAVGSYTSHVTGNVARIGDELAQGHGHLALRWCGFAGAFVLGAMVATGMVLWARARGEARYFRGLLLEAILLAIFASLNLSADKPRLFFNDFVLTALLCFAMGLQNAMVTKLSGARIRTTHLTGVTTDIGIEAVRLGHRFWQRLRTAPLAAVVRDLWSDSDFVHLRLHASIWLSFLLGAVVGPLGYIRVGHFALLIPCAILVVLAIYDLVLGLTESRGPALAAAASS
jgi:uncharacterized membrane protein YoaK (UPF0700 family)